MQKRIIKPWQLLASLALLIALALTAVSCGEDEADPKEATADFTYVVNPDGSGSVAFTNTSEDGDEYSWDFGDGSAASTDESPTHVYTESGTFTVELTALGDDGTDPSVKTEDVEVELAEVLGPNLLVGGNFETADAASWTKIQGNITEPEPTFTFGATTGLPTGSTGGGFRLVNDANAAKNVIFYQAVTLAVGTYRFSGLVKIDARASQAVEDAGNPDKLLSHFWFESYVGLTQPTSGDGYNKDADMIAGFNGWNGSRHGALDGSFPTVAYGFGSPATPKADVNGNFAVTTAGTYYFVFKSGYCCSGGYGSGITIDNWKLQKVD